MTNIMSTIERLFTRYWDDDISEDEETQIEEMAAALVEQNDWHAVYSALTAFLLVNCVTPEQAINTAHIFWELGWCEQPIVDPYRFLGYLYYRIDFNSAQHDKMDMMDTLTTAILLKAGYTYADMYINSDYTPETDAKLIEAVNNWRSGIYHDFPNT